MILLGVVPRFSDVNGSFFSKSENHVFHFAFSGTHLMLWVADEIAQLPSLLVQLIGNCTPPPFFSFKKKKGFGVIFWTCSSCIIIHGGLG